MNDNTAQTVTALKNGEMETQTAATMLDLAANYRDMANLIEDTLTVAASAKDARAERREMELAASALIGLMLQGGKAIERRLLDGLLHNLQTERPSKEGLDG